jgi:hypothetical protein
MTTSGSAALLLNAAAAAVLGTHLSCMLLPFALPASPADKQTRGTNHSRSAPVVGTNPGVTALTTSGVALLLRLPSFDGCGSTAAAMCFVTHRLYNCTQQQQTQQQRHSYARM